VCEEPDRRGVILSSLKARLRPDMPLILVTLLAVLAIAPLTYPGFFQAHSGFLPVFNSSHPAEAPDWGRLPDPVRGEGRLPYLLIWPFWKLSASGVVAVKWGYGLAFVLGAWGVYAWAGRWLGERGGGLAALLYTCLPWHLGTVYVRGACAEAWLWAWWPFALWAVDRLAEGRVLTAALVGLPVLAAAFWTQAGLAALFLPLLALYGAGMTAGRQRWAGWLAVAPVISAVVLWFTARLAPPARLPFADHLLYPSQLFSPAGGEGLSFQVGVAAVGLSIVAVALGVSHKEARSALGRALGFWLTALLLLLLLTLRPAAPFWQITGLDTLLTYPWQLLALAGLPLAFLAGSVVRLEERLAELPAWGGLLALAVLASYPCLAPRFTRLAPGPEPLALFQPVESPAPQILLLRAEVAPPTEITPTLTLTLTWQAVEPVAGDYTVFVHLLAGGERKIAQRDTRPCDGRCPTNHWQPGEILADRYVLALPPDAPPGPYRLAVGLYLLETGERAGVVGRADRTVYLDVK